MPYIPFLLESYPRANFMAARRDIMPPLTPPKAPLP